MLGHINKGENEQEKTMRSLVFFEQNFLDLSALRNPFVQTCNSTFFAYIISELSLVFSFRSK